MAHPTQIDRLLAFLKSRGACEPSIAWLEKQPTDKPLVMLFNEMGTGNGMAIGWSAWLLATVLPQAAVVALLVAMIRRGAVDVRSTAVNNALTAIDRYMAGFDRDMVDLNTALTAMYAQGVMRDVERNMVAAVDRAMCIAIAPSMGWEHAIALRAYLGIEYLWQGVIHSSNSPVDASHHVMTTMRMCLPWAALAGPLGAAIGCNLIAAEGHADAVV